MPFQGRTVQGVEKNNKGLEESLSIIGVGDGYAGDMDNWEVAIKGSIQTRLGMTEQYDFTGGGAPKTMQYFGTYFTNDGVQVYVAVVDTSFYEATAPTGPWTDRTGSVVLTVNNGPWIGSDLNGKFVLANGTDQPIEHEPGINARTLESVSLIAPPQGVIYTKTGTPVTEYYAVTALTARGETTISNVVGETNASATVLSITDYYTVAWDLRAGAQGYNIYKQNGTQWQLINSVGALTNQWSDQGATILPGGPPDTNTAYNTPLSWLTAPPQGFGIVSRGRSQRMMAWRNAYIWGSALSDLLDWETNSNAFQVVPRGGRDNTIKCMATLYDYTVFFSDTNAFVYSGSNYNDFELIKLLNVGCRAPHSIVTSGDEAWFWSDIGPNTLSRVMAGQDLQTNRPFSQPVVNTVNTLSNKDAWYKIVAWNDVRLLRVAWCYPTGTDTTNSKAILRTTTNSVWSRHSMPDVVNAVTDENRNVYAATRGAKIYRLYQGSVGPNLYPATYETGWYDSQSNLLRYMEYLDVVVDKTLGNYSLQAELFWDFSTTAASTHTLTQTQTDGIDVAVTTPTANVHRCFTRGIGRWFKFKFTVAEGTAQVSILGWREEMYAKGRA